jgi:hypothetical protein
MAHLFSCTIFISIKISSKDVSNLRSIFQENTITTQSAGPSEDFKIDVTKTFCWAVHTALFNTS